VGRSIGGIGTGRLVRLVARLGVAFLSKKPIIGTRSDHSATIYHCHYEQSKD
jgi:hypothetical protein